MANEKQIQPLNSNKSMIPKTQVPTDVANVIDRAKQAGQPQASMQTGVQPPTAKDVLGEDNVTQALTEPSAQPQSEAPTGLEADKMELANLMGTLRTGTQAIEQQNVGAFGTTGVSANLMGGQMRQFEEGIVNKARLLQDKIDIQQDERDKMESIMRENPGAGISTEDSFEDAIAKAAKWQINEETRKLETAEKFDIRGEERAEARGIRGEERGERRMIEGEERAFEREMKKLEKMEKADLKSLALSLGIDPKGKNLAKKIAEKQSGEMAFNQRVKDMELKIKQESYRKQLRLNEKQTVDWTKIDNNPVGNESTDTSTGENKPKGFSFSISNFK